MIQVYSPTNVATKEEKEEFTNLIEKIVNDEKEHYNGRLERKGRY